MAKKITNPKLFSAAWTEKDEAVLIDLLDRKIGELRFDIKESDSPYVKARLRAKRKEYKALLQKVQVGEYNSNILVAELAAANLATRTETVKKEKKLGKYVDAYEDVNFDFSGYFRKTRYFGTLLPIISLILTVVFALFLFIGASFSGTPAYSEAVERFEASINNDPAQNTPRLTLTSLGYLKLSDDFDFSVPNRPELWPKGTYLIEEEANRDDPYIAPDGSMPDTVFLHKDLGMSTIDITTADIYKAFFRTPAMTYYSIPAVERIIQFNGPTWYYYAFIEGRDDEIKIQRGDDGKYDPVVIVRNIGTYGLIAFMLIALVLSLVEIGLSIGRLFSYTSRRLHIIPLFIFISIIMAVICPVFANIPSLESADVQSAFAEYFQTSWGGFLEGSGTINFNFLYAGAVGIMLIVLILPFLFRNRQAKPITFVPKGNRPHTFPGQEYPVKPGKPPIYPKQQKRAQPAYGQQGYNPYMMQPYQGARPPANQQATSKKPPAKSKKTKR
ncbi:MAG: hypothetical protein WC292_00455 [Clostridia bacterium]